VLIAIGVILAVALVLGIGIPAVLGGTSGVTISLPGGVHVYTGERYKGALWLQKYQRQVITELNKDQEQILADNPAVTHPASASVWLVDWQRFHADLLRDASLPPNPDPQAEKAWRGMLTNWTTASEDAINALTHHNESDALAAQTSLDRGDASATAFNNVFDLKPPSLKLPSSSTSPA
jgi:hypothetical protein